MPSIVNKIAKFYVISAGGTGGYMFPALAFADNLRKAGHKVVLITDQRGRKFAPNFEPAYVLNIQYRIFDTFKETFYCVRLLRETKPAAVIGFGGYPSVPAVLAAQLLGIPTILHEQNAVMGKANRYLSFIAKKVALGLKMDTKNAKKFVYVGNPIRHEFNNIEPYQIPKNYFRILVLGGSQGAEIFSQVIPKALLQLSSEKQKRIQIFQQCRPNLMQETKDAYKDFLGEFMVADFFHQVHGLYELAHLVISRAGASTISELCASGRPSILVPFSGANAHQKENAKLLENHQACKIIDHYHFTVNRLSKEIAYYMDHPEELEKMAQNARQLSPANPADSFMQLLAEI